MSNIQPGDELMPHDLSHFVFFFQAEDGIRDRNVTGVQTCALPICLAEQRWCLAHRDRTWAEWDEALPLERRLMRSEERRVGKEWRAGWVSDIDRKNERMTDGRAHVLFLALYI